MFDLLTGILSLWLFFFLLETIVDSVEGGFISWKQKRFLKKLHDSPEWKVVEKLRAESEAKKTNPDNEAK